MLASCPEIKGLHGFTTKCDRNEDCEAGKMIPAYWAILNSCWSVEAELQVITTHSIKFIVTMSVRTSDGKGFC